MITLNGLYYLVGTMFLVFGILNFTNPNKKLANKIAGGLFWTGYSITFLLAEFLPPFIMGLIVILLALIAFTNILKPAAIQNYEEVKAMEEKNANIFKNKLFIPALLVPLLTLIGTFTLPYVPFVEGKNHTLIALIFSICIAIILALTMFKASGVEAMKNGAHTMDEIGWAALLPQILAALGIIFLGAGMGEEISKLLTHFFSFNNTFIAVCAYTLSMALFTMIMGNAFAAFPVITAGLALPILVHNMGGNPAIIGAIGMLSGFCGTLMTPMAANFNIVPAALLNLDDKNGVIKVQFLTAILLLISNTLLIYFLAF